MELIGLGITFGSLFILTVPYGYIGALVMLLSGSLVGFLLRKNHPTHFVLTFGIAFFYLLGTLFGMWLNSTISHSGDIFSGSEITAFAYGVSFILGSIGVLGILIGNYTRDRTLQHLLKSFFTSPL